MVKLKEMSLGCLLECLMAIQLAAMKELYSVQLMEMCWEKLMEIQWVTVTAYSMAPQKVMQKDDLMATSWAHLKEISMAMQKVRLTEMEKVQMMEIPMEMSLEISLAVRSAIQMVLMMGLNWVHLTEIWLAQLKVKQKETSLDGLLDC